MFLKGLYSHLLHNIDIVHLSTLQDIIETRIKPVAKESEEEVEIKE